MKKRSVIVLVVACLIFVISSRGSDSDDRITRIGKIPFAFLHLWHGQADTLAGLGGIHVTITLDDEAKELGLSEQTLKNQVELQLQGNGILIVSKEEYEKHSIFSRKVHDFVAEGYAGLKRANYTQEMIDYGYLQFEVTATSTEYPIAGNVRVTLCQSALLSAFLPEKVMFTPCVTWGDGTTGAYGASAFSEQMPRTIAGIWGRHT